MTELDYDVVFEGLRNAQLRKTFLTTPDVLIDRIWRSDRHGFSNRSGLAASLRHRANRLEEMGVDESPLAESRY